MREMKIRSNMYPNWRLEIKDNGSVYWAGVERGPLTLHYENKTYLVLKEAGHQWYHNQYNGSQYEPAKYIVLKKVGEADSLGALPNEAVLEEVLEFYVKQDLSFLKS